MTERPEDDLSFASPGPEASGPAPDGTRGPARPSPGPAPTGASDRRPVDPGARWGVPGPTPAERAAARRRARIWVLSVLALILLVVGGAVGASYLTTSTREEAWEPVAADVTAPETVNAVQLVLGSCLAEAPTDGAVGRVEVVPCGEPHAAEVVGRTDASADAVWPGADEAAARTARGCTPDLLGPQARADDSTRVELVVWAPSEESWAAGDRTGLCVAVVDGTRTGSLLD
ncbi:septum formation family protein [Isoptericola sp. 178]|uniref:septum formation family protein n=1 Tax=Isoptericola sp. 178 TaxID=3064651 RepID=UPI0027134D26|nr:septum formation family protein [Isoptericola sp. 178]MDO8143481.1 septum formation family protein [Isoptericola sp. 178]